GRRTRQRDRRGGEALRRQARRGAHRAGAARILRTEPHRLQEAEVHRVPQGAAEDERRQDPAARAARRGEREAGGVVRYLLSRYSCSRSRNRCSLPVSVLGNESQNSIARGYLYGAIVCLTKFCSSATSASLALQPFFSTTKALTICPRASSGTPTTPHSATASCSSSADSTSGPAML